MESGWTLQQTFVFPPATTPVYSPQLLVRWVSAVGTRSLGPRPFCYRSVRVHQNSQMGCRLLSTTTQRARATSTFETCGRSRVASLFARLPPGVPPWLFNPQHVANTPRIVRAHVHRWASVQPVGVAHMVNVVLLQRQVADGSAGVLNLAW